MSEHPDAPRKLFSTLRYANAYLREAARIIALLNGGIIATSFLFIVALFGYSSAKPLSGDLSFALDFFAVALPLAMLSSFLALNKLSALVTYLLTATAIAAVESGVFTVLQHMVPQAAAIFGVTCGLCWLILVILGRPIFSTVDNAADDESRKALDEFLHTLTEEERGILAELRHAAAQSDLKNESDPPE
jgi:hypothetical protein